MSKFIIVISIIFLASCGTKNVYVLVERPAQIDLSEYDKIIVGDFIEQGYNLAHFLQSELSSRIQSTGRFDLYSGIPIDNRSGVIAPDLLLLNGDIIENFADHEIEFLEDVMQEDSTIKKKYEVTIRSSLKINFRLLDFGSGKILFTRTLEESDVYSRNYLESFNPNPKKREMLENSKLHLIDRFMKMILPYSVRQAAPFQFEGNKFDKGIKLAELGEWESAIDFFFDIAKKSEDPETYAMATFNLGLCYLYIYEFETARNKFKEAYDHDDRSLYLDEIAVANRMERDYEKLLDQNSNP